MTDLPSAVSVVIPTFERRAVLMASLHGLVTQSTNEPFDVVVVIDGGTDDTAQTLDARTWPFPLRVIEQANSGAAAARNAGAEATRAPILLFLDDDMESTSSVIDVHLAAHREGADAVVGAMPLHPASPSTFLATGVGRWADKMADRCSAPGYVMTADDVFTGHLSVRRDLFDALGGFNTRFTSGGTFGNEDVDLAQRLVDRQAAIVFRADAITRQRFVVTALQHLRRGEDLGHADMTLLRTHPELDDQRRVAALRESPQDPIGRAVLRFPRAVSACGQVLERPVAAAVDSGLESRFVRRALRALHDIRYWKGVRRAGGPLTGTGISILCWHALQDLSDDPILAAYGVPPEVLADQLDTLLAAGWAALTPTEVVAFIRDGAPIPARSFFVTFDDCYAELPTHGVRILAAAAVPSAAFVVTTRVGDCNRWDTALGARSLPLASWSELAALVEGDADVELGAHSRTHPKLSTLGPEDLTLEVAGAGADLAAQGVHARLFAYPHGEHNAAVEAAVANAGFDVAFTVTPGVARTGESPYRVPRLEVFPDDRGRQLVRKVALGGRWPLLSSSWATRRALVRAEARRVRRGVARRIRARAAS